MKPLELSIKKTLAYFKIFNRVLNKREIFNFLWQPPFCGFDDFSYVFDDINDLENKNNFQSQQREVWLNDKKMQLAKKTAGWLKFVPFIRAIYVCNSVSFLSSKEDSDIDLFIITSPKRIWLVRFFSNVVLRFLGKRVYKGVSRDKICLSFFVDEQNLNFSDIRIKEDDIYLVYWLKTLVPVFYHKNFSGDLIEKNYWLKKFAPHGLVEPILSPWGVEDNGFSRAWKKFWETAWQGNYGNILEKQAMDFQKTIIKKNISDPSLLDGKRVVYNNSMIKLHQNDAREKIYKEWQKNCL